MGGKENKISCTECEQVFTLKKNLYRHLRTIHHIDPIVKHEPTFHCDICDKKFSTKSNLSQHTKKFHNISDHDYICEAISASKNKKTRLICPDLCDEEFPTHLQLCSHLQEDHELNIDFEELEFNSMQGIIDKSHQVFNIQND